MLVKLLNNAFLHLKEPVASAVDHIPQKMLAGKTDKPFLSAPPLPVYPHSAYDQAPLNHSDRNQVIKALQQYGTSVEGKKKLPHP